MTGKTSQAGGRRQYNEIDVLIKARTGAATYRGKTSQTVSSGTGVLMGEETFLGSGMGVIPSRKNSMCKSTKASHKFLGDRSEMPCGWSSWYTQTSDGD